MQPVKADHASRRHDDAPRQHRFGAHLSIAGGVSNALLEAQRLRMDTVQVFVKNQRQWRAAPLQPDDVKRWHALLAEPGFGPVIAHATYLINLASPDSALAEKSRIAFGEELRRCDELGIAGLVVHPGSPREGERAASLTQVAKQLDLIFAEQPQTKTLVLLETTAGQGASLGHTFEELAEIIGQVAEGTRVGVCVDTCHVFAAGYDIRDPQKYADMIDLAGRTVGLERIRCWHLNDSVGDCGSRKDRHAHIGDGCIGRVGFHNLLADTRFAGLPMLLETPDGTDERGREWHLVNLARLRRIARSATGQPTLEEDDDE